MWRVGDFTRQDQFLALPFARLICRVLLREIKVKPRAVQTKLSWPARCSRNNLIDSAKNR